MCGLKMKSCMGILQGQPNNNIDGFIVSVSVDRFSCRGITVLRGPVHVCRREAVVVHGVRQLVLQRACIQPQPTGSSSSPVQCLPCSVGGGGRIEILSC